MLYIITSAGIVFITALVVTITYKLCEKIKYKENDTLKFPLRTRLRWKKQRIIGVVLKKIGYKPRYTHLVHKSEFSEKKRKRRKRLVKPW